jgi:hypothetical protein
VYPVGAVVNAMVGRDCVYAMGTVELVPVVDTPLTVPLLVV